MTLEEHPEFERVLRAMKPHDQCVLVPYFVYGYTAAEIADVLGIERRSAHLRIQRGLERTRIALGIHDG